MRSAGQQVFLLSTTRPHNLNAPLHVYLRFCIRKFVFRAKMISERVSFCSLVVQKNQPTNGNYYLAKRANGKRWLCDRNHVIFFYPVGKTIKKNREIFILSTFFIQPLPCVWEFIKLFYHRQPSFVRTNAAAGQQWFRFFRVNLSTAEKLQSTQKNQREVKTFQK